ncbi:hypothetical protein KUTG_10185 [Kutzneria sp. 744]|nr:hypothetical protein KUTG_10185 [Kutzneria sp. 744]
MWRWRLTGNDMPERRMVHGALARCLDDDHHAARKAWSWTAHRGPSGLAVDIGLLDDALADRLIAGTDRLRGLLPLAGVEQVSGCDWAGLLAGPKLTEWTVRFVSPVTFRRGNRFLPWPSPSAVLGSLRTSWRTFAAPHVGDVSVDLSTDPVVVASIEGSSPVERVVLHDRPDAAGKRGPVTVSVGGFQGQVRFVADAPGFDPTGVNALVRLAQFCGVGAYTTRGFGGVRLPVPGAPAACDG